MSCPENPAQVTLANGTVVSGGPLQLGCSFYWANPSSSKVTVSNCSAFCTESSYEVPGKTAGSSYGLCAATLVSTQPTSWQFSQNPNQWNAPGMPRIDNPPSLGVAPKEGRERDVA
jgi:hypothetical protein